MKAQLLQQTTQQRPASALGIRAMGMTTACNMAVTVLAARRNSIVAINANRLDGNRVSVNNASRQVSVVASRIHRFNSRNSWKFRSIIRGEIPQVAGG